MADAYRGIELKLLNYLCLLQVIESIFQILLVDRYKYIYEN